MMFERKPIAVTIGDPAGIGPEIVAKLFAAGLPAPAIAVGDASAIRKAVAQLATPLAIQLIAKPSEARHEPGNLPLLAVSDLGPDLIPGKIDARCGRSAYDAIVTAARLAISGDVAAVVTAPINKEALHAAGINFPGHTELLAAEAKVEHVAMMLANDELRVLLVSIHVALSEAIKAVTIENELRAIGFARDACIRLGIAKPRIAVAGLNPHAGEGGLMGREEIEIIAPAVKLARDKGIHVSGPFPPDTIFMRARKGAFDIVVSQYHDQGLIPVKYLGLDKGVNVTVGLPFVRTSVDHGTAFEIAGQGIADASSLRAAFDMAVAMTSTSAV